MAVRSRKHTDGLDEKQIARADEDRTRDDDHAPAYEARRCPDMAQ